MATENSELTDLKSPSEIQAAHPNLFPSATSMQWYLRQHRDELVEAGALLKHNGRVMLAEGAFRVALRQIAQASVLGGKAA